jgi:hypothetical protein
MAPKVVVLEFQDPSLQALQLARILPFTVTVDPPTDPDEKDPDSKGAVKKAIREEYKATIKQVKADTYLPDDSPVNEPVAPDIGASPPPKVAEPEKAEK